MDDLSAWDWTAWKAASPAQRLDRMRAAASRVGGAFSMGLECPQVDVRGCSMVLVPGGRVELGWDGTPAKLTPSQRAHWSARGKHEESFEGLLAVFLGPRRTVTLPPMLVERTPISVADLGVDAYGGNVEDAARDAVRATGFFVLGDDAWENAARAGTTSLFPWGDEWPEGEPYGSATTFTRHLEPNALGIRLLANPYDLEIVQERDVVRGGDGGSALCGGRPHPEAWYSFALAFRYPRSLWGDIVPELYEAAHVRRCLPLG